MGITGQRIEPKLPAVRAAMGAGGISATHVDRIAKVIGQVADEHVDQVDAELAELAQQFTPTAVGRSNIGLTGVRRRWRTWCSSAITTTG